VNTPQRCLPHPLQFLGWLQKRLPLWKDQKGLARNQLLVQPPYKFTKDSLGSVAPDRIPKPFADDDPYPTGGIIHFVRQKIEERRGDPVPMALHRFDIPAGP
jgi:hypothetical protein